MSGHLSPSRNKGRRIGLLYLLVSLPGAFALLYVPGKLIVNGNALATAGNIAAHETLFRLGIVAHIASQILFLWVALALYDLLKGINSRHASLMFGLIAVSVPISLLNELNSIGALALIRGAYFLGVIEKVDRDALAMLLLNLHGEGIGIAAIFWGLWLFPLGLLVYRSELFPRILGILLVSNCLAYLINSFTSLLVPQYGGVVARWVLPLTFGELAFILWLLIMGTKPNMSAVQAGA